MTYKEDFFAKFPDAPRGYGPYSEYPIAQVWEIYNVDRVLECIDCDNKEAWDKPIGYWD